MQASASEEGEVTEVPQTSNANPSTVSAVSLPTPSLSLSSLPNSADPWAPENFTRAYETFLLCYAHYTQTTGRSNATGNEQKPQLPLPPALNIKDM